MSDDEWDFDYVDVPQPTGLDVDAVNEAIVAWEMQDPANWRTHPSRSALYYIGPRISGDGSIDWRDDGWPE
jgi:hypothetical protein